VHIDTGCTRKERKEKAMKKMKKIRKKKRSPVVFVFGVDLS
jgi:hypothetical protein